jgi:hypothetical protein
MNRSIPIALAGAIFVLHCVEPVRAQSTQTGTVSPGANRNFRFTPAGSGQFTATLSWDNAGSTLLMVLVCGTDNPISYGAAAGGLDRTARLESGLIGLNPCLIAISTTSSSPAATFRLNLQHSSNQLATPQAATLTGVTAPTATPVDAALVRVTHQILADIAERVR